MVYRSETREKWSKHGAEPYGGGVGGGRGSGKRGAGLGGGGGSGGAGGIELGGDGSDDGGDLGRHRGLLGDNVDGPGRHVGRDYAPKDNLRIAGDDSEGDAVTPASMQ